MIFHSQLDLEENQREGGTNNSRWYFDRVPCVKCAFFFNRIDVNRGPSVWYREVISSPGREHSSTLRLILIRCSLTIMSPVVPSPKN